MREGQTLGEGRKAARTRRMAGGGPATGRPKEREAPFSQGGSGPKNKEARHNDRKTDTEVGEAAGGRVTKAGGCGPATQDHQKEVR